MANETMARKAGEEMRETVTKAADMGAQAAREAGHQAANGVAEGQKAFETMSGQASEAMERMSHGMSQAGEMMRGNMEAMMAAARACAQGCEQLAGVMTEQSKKSLEDAQVAMRLMAGAKSPNELMELSQDFWRNRFDQSIQGWSKLTETWLKVAGDTVQPLSSRMAVATDQMKKALQPSI